MNRRVKLVFGIAVLALVVPAGVEFYTDWLWFGETGFRNVFLNKITTQGYVGAAAAALAFVALFGSVRLALRGFVARQLVVTTREGPIAIAIAPRRARALTTVIASVLALLLGLYAASHWLTCFGTASRSGNPIPYLVGTSATTCSSCRSLMHSAVSCSLS